MRGGDVIAGDERNLFTARTATNAALAAADDPSVARHLACAVRLNRAAAGRSSHAPARTASNPCQQLAWPGSPPSPSVACQSSPSPSRTFTLPDRGRVLSDINPKERESRSAYALRSANQSSLRAMSSLGKWPRFLTILRNATLAHQSFADARPVASQQQPLRCTSSRTLNNVTRDADSLLDSRVGKRGMHHEHQAGFTERASDREPRARAPASIGECLF